MSDFLDFFKNVVGCLCNFDYFIWIIPPFLITAVFNWIYNK